MTNPCRDCKHCSVSGGHTAIPEKFTCHRWSKKTVHPVSGRECLTGGIDCYDARSVDGHCSVGGKYFEWDGTLSGTTNRLSRRFWDLPFPIMLFVFFGTVALVTFLIKMLGVIE